jgi:hypothetical protein
MSATAFEFFETLGEGTAGVVYRAKDPKGREVAVKLLREAAAKDEDLLRRFRREVDLATSLEHENLVNALEGGRTAAGRLYLTSELVRGSNAARLLEANRPLPEAAALGLARGVLRALAYLHEKKLVHRDVKPENVLVGRDGSVKLSDFGLARSAAPGGARLTATGEVLGTPYYIAPEQIRAEKDIDARADLYSLGCMLYEWLAGKRPFDGASVVEILSGHVKGEPPALAGARPGLQERTLALVQALMRKARAERPASPAQPLAEVDAALAALGAGDGREAVAACAAKVPEASGAAKPTAAGGTHGQTLSSADAIAAQGGKSARWKLKLSGSKGTLTLFVFAGERLQLGRDSIDRETGNDVCLRVRGPGGDVGSRKIATAHLRVEITPQGAFVKDLETQNGTRVLGNRLQPRVAHPVRTSAKVDVAGGLELEVKTIPSETPGAPPAAVLISRPQNGTDHAYALVRERILIGESGGAPVAGAHAGSALALAGGAFTLNGQPLEAGRTVEASRLKVEVLEIRPEDMK